CICIHTAYSETVGSLPRFSRLYFAALFHYIWDMCSFLYFSPLIPPLPGIQITPGTIKYNHLVTGKILPAPKWVENPVTLDALIQTLKRHPRVAVDTESNSLHAFQEQVCLIQFSILDMDFLVDPLAIEDISPLATIFSNPYIEKVFHAAEYDLICLKRDFDFTVNHIFDTMQAARILGLKQVSLDSLLTERFAVKQDKRYQKADWGQRPLTADLMNYARLDTRFLLPLRDQLKRELTTRDLWTLADEEFVRISQENTLTENGIPAWQRINGVQSLSPRQLTVLHELSKWRDTQARNMDRPVFKVIDDKRLLSIAKSGPKTFEDLEALYLTPRQLTVYGDGLLKAVREGARATIVKRVHHSRPSKEYLARLDGLREWRKSTAVLMGIQSDLILPKSFLASIAASKPQTVTELAQAMPGSPWRVEKFGQEILSVLKKE
ncbi:MAG: HRDC domain-containing protein, partial [Chloroflexota bacterium]